MFPTDLKNVTIGEIGRAIDKIGSAEIRRSSDLRPKMLTRISLVLDTAATEQNPYIVPFPFDGLYVEATTGVATNAFLGLGSLDSYNTSNQSAVVGLYRNASFKSDTVIKQGVLTWPAQANTTMTIVFFHGIDFRPGSQISQLTGSISVGSSSNLVTGTLGAGGAATSVVVGAGVSQLLITDATRISATLYTPNDIWVGDASVAVNRGVFVSGGSQFIVNTTAAVYAIRDSVDSQVSGFVES